MLLLCNCHGRLYASRHNSGAGARDSDARQTRRIAVSKSDPAAVAWNFDRCRRVEVLAIGGRADVEGGAQPVRDAEISAPFRAEIVERQRRRSGDRFQPGDPSCVAP